jgi:Complex 1 protein (LYR family)
MSVWWIISKMTSSVFSPHGSWHDVTIYGQIFPNTASSPAPTCTSHGLQEMRLSGLQRQVLSLYRQCLREARKKPFVRLLLFFHLDDVSTDWLDRRYSKTSKVILGVSLPSIHRSSMGNSPSNYSSEESSNTIRRWTRRILRLSSIF